MFGLYWIGGGVEVFIVGDRWLQGRGDAARFGDVGLAEIVVIGRRWESMAEEGARGEKDVVVDGLLVPGIGCSWDEITEAAERSWKLGEFDYGGWAGLDGL